MKFKFDNNIPIHQQLVDQISYYIISGYLKPAEKLPSVRELSIMAEVNHNTIQKALFEVESLGLIITNRTSGKFVTEDVEAINVIPEEEDFKNEGLQKNSFSKVIFLGTILPYNKGLVNIVL